MQNSVPSEGNHFLREVANLYPFGNEDLSFVNRFLSQDHSEEGRFPGTIGADKTNPIPHPDLKGAVLKEDSASKLFLNVVKCDHKIGNPCLRRGFGRQKNFKIQTSKGFTLRD